MKATIGRMRIWDNNYRFVVLLTIIIVLIALSLAHEGKLIPFRVDVPQFYDTTTYTVERFIFLGIGIFSGAYFGKKVGFIVLAISFAIMLVNCLFVSESNSAWVQAPAIFLAGLFIVFLFDSQRKYTARERVLKEAQSLGRIGSWEYEIKTRKLTWSDETFVLYERTPVSGIPSYKELFGYYKPEQANWLKDTAKTAIESGQVRSIDVELELPSDIAAYHHVIIKPEKDIRKNIIKLTGTVQDVTEQKKVERMKDEFIALVSHELRTPLTVINGSLQVALDERTSLEDKQELLVNAVENTEILGNILENMVELARYQIGKLQLNVEPVDIGKISSKIIDKLRGFGATQSFLIEITDELPQVKADPLRIERILYNLLENAVKYSNGKSEIMVQAGVEGEFLIVKIIDQGKGISKENQKNLFQLFSGNENGMEVDGMGLGLMVSKRLLESHNGWIRVESAIGVGSTFTFGIPLSYDES